MVSIEMLLITRRQIPKELIESFDRQTSRDFNMKILTRYSQPWKVEDLDIDFSLEVIPQKLFYSSGTRFGICVASNELLTYAESKYVLFLDDFIIIPPFSVEKLIPLSDDNLIICSVETYLPKEKVWKQGVYDALFEHQTPEYGLTVFLPGEQTPCVTHTGCMLFPLKTLKKVDGWDLAYDGAWGGADPDLYNRMRAAKVDYGCFNQWYTYHFKHKYLITEETDDPPICDGSFVINKESGTKTNIEGKHICIQGKVDSETFRAVHYELTWDLKFRYPICGLREMERMLKT